MFGSTEGALAINHPIRAEQPPEHDGERGLRLKVRKGSVETKLALAVQGPKARYKLPSKHAAKGFDGQKKPCGAPEPVLGVDAVMKLHEYLANWFRKNESKFVRACFVNGLPGFITLGADGELQTTALEIENGKIAVIHVVRNHGTFWGHDGTVWGAGAISMTRADGEIVALKAPRRVETLTLIASTRLAPDAPSMPTMDPRVPAYRSPSF